MLPQSNQSGPFKRKIWFYLLFCLNHSTVALKITAQMLWCTVRWCTIWQGPPSFRNTPLSLPAGHALCFSGSLLQSGHSHMLIHLHDPQPNSYSIVPQQISLFQRGFSGFFIVNCVPLNSQFFLLHNTICRYASFIRLFASSLYLVLNSMLLNEKDCLICSLLYTQHPTEFLTCS